MYVFLLYVWSIHGVSFFLLESCLTSHKIIAKLNILRIRTPSSFNTNPHSTTRTHRTQADDIFMSQETLRNDDVRPD